MAITRISTSLSLPVELIKAIDKRRGYMPRSAWIVQILERELARLERQERDPLHGVVKRVGPDFRDL